MSSEEKTIAYVLAPCTLADAPELARNNISAFWQNLTWVLAWKHTTLDKHIVTTAKRYPRTLIRNRTTMRHQKVIDSSTGRLVGYARWEIPVSHATTSNGSPAWEEAIFPIVTSDEEAEIQRIADATPFNPNPYADALDIEVNNMEKEQLAKATKPYMRLDYLAVHPDNQGKGIANLLVKSGISKAKKLDIDIFVVAFSPAFKLYKSLGFRVEKELVQDDSAYGGLGNYTVRCMIYENERTP